MGNLLSPKKISKIQANCSCSLCMYTEYNHSCQKECFPKIKNVASFIHIPCQYGQDQWSFSRSHQESLNNVLASYQNDISLKYFVFIISSYLNSMIMGKYNVYCHGEITKAIQNECNPFRLCPMWIKKYMGEFKIGVFGGGGAGKSSLVIRFLTNMNTNYFSDEYDPTIEDSYRKEIILDKNEILLDILDTACQQQIQYTSMTDQWMRDTQIHLLVFAIDSKFGLYECIDFWDKTIRNDLYWNNDEHHFCRSGVILVAAKCDLMYNDAYNFDENKKKLMQKNYETAMKLSKIWNVAFVETSAKENINVALLFKQTIFEYWIQTQTKSCNWDTNEHCKLW
eukprot:274015_1